MRLTAVFFVIFAALATLCLATPYSGPVDNSALAVQGDSEQAYVLSMQRCKGSNSWTLHGLWPEWAQNCGNDFSMAKLAPLMSQLQTDWPSCPEFGKSNQEFWAHEHNKHLTCHIKRTGVSQLQAFQQSLDLLHKFRGRCQDSITRECRIGLDANLKPLDDVDTALFPIIMAILGVVALIGIGLLGYAWYTRRNQKKLQKSDDSAHDLQDLNRTA